jgi:hypothetical protein
MGGRALGSSGSGKGQSETSSDQDILAAVVIDLLVISLLTCL